MRTDDAGDFGTAAEAAGSLFAAAAAEGGPFAGSKVEPTAIERVVGEMIWRHQGRANPISIAKLAAATGHGERAVKGIVEQLVVTHRLKIGGKRGEPVGYFVVVDAEDQAVATRPFREQILAMLRRLRVLEDKPALREFLGQLAIEEE